LEEHIALKRNESEQKKLDQEEAFHDLESRLEIKTLELRSLELVRDRSQQFFESGSISRNTLDVSIVNVERARMEQVQLDHQVGHACRRAAAQTDKLGLELRLLQREREQAQREMELATARANRDGVITWLPSLEGQALRRGEEIARIADLSTFRVEARLSDAYTDRIATGQPVRVQVGEELLPGRVQSVYPAVEAGVVRLLLELDAGDHPRLRANQRVEAHLVVQERAEALKVKRGAFVSADGRPAVFVVNGKVARRRTVEFGIADFEEIEVLAGLEPGDEVITSDMNDYAHLQEVKLR
jgi:HlyD family secretion protein